MWYAAPVRLSAVGMIDEFRIESLHVRVTVDGDMCAISLILLICETFVSVWLRGKIPPEGSYLVASNVRVVSVPL